MEGKSTAQAERSAQPTNPKRALRSSTAAQAPTVNNGNSSTGKADISVLTQATRAHLDKGGFLKKDEPVTATSAHEAFKKIFEKIKAKCQPDVHTILISFMMLLGELATEKELSRGGEAEKIAKQVSTHIDSAVEKGIQKLSNLVDVSLANQKDLQNTAKKLGEVAEVIHKTTEEVSKNLAEASDTSNKLTTTMGSYKDMLMTAPRPPMASNAVGANRSTPTDPRISRDIERKSKQVLVDIFNKEVVNQSLEELKARFNKLIREAEDVEKPEGNVEVQQIIKLKMGG